MIDELIRGSLSNSTPDAHAAIAECVAGGAHIEPFVIARDGMERSFRAFSIKFDSIKRHYEVLAGADPLAELQIDRELCAFLCEQTLRNLRLRSVQAFIRWRRNGRRYMQYVANTVPQLIIDLSEVLRLRDIDVPDDFRARLPILSEQFGYDYSVLTGLLELKQHPHRPLPQEIENIHRIIFGALDHAVNWMADHG